MYTEIDVHAYVQDLEKHLQLSLFGGGTADPEGAVLLVRGALAEGDQRKAADLAESTQRLATTTPATGTWRRLPTMPADWLSRTPPPWSGRPSATRPR